MTLSGAVVRSAKTAAGVFGRRVADGFFVLRVELIDARLCTCCGDQSSPPMAGSVGHAVMHTYVDDRHYGFYMNWVELAHGKVQGM